MEETEEQIIRINGKDFERYISKKDIKKDIKLLAEALNIQFADKDPVFLPVLNGSFVFAADLLKQIKIHNTLSFVKIKSYTGMKSSGAAKELIGIEKDLRGKHVIVIEDIIDTGFTMKYLLAELHTMAPASITVVTLLIKRDCLQFDFEPDYALFEIPDIFVVGYGLDYDGYGRNLKHIYKIVKD